MGFYIRKALSAGPFRLNLSKSGLGVSFGVKGARVSMGPRGAYVHMGRHGIYYRQRIDVPAHPISPGLPQPVQPDTSSLEGEIKTADVSQLVDSSSGAVLSQINDRLKKTRLFPVYGVATLIATSAAFSNIEWLGFVILVIGSLLTIMTFRKERIQRTTPLFYELDQTASEKFAEIQKACGYLVSPIKTWRVESRTPNWDWKRNAGASSLLTRRSIRFGPQKLPYIATNIPVIGANLGKLSLFFLPDHMLVFQRGTYGAVSYENLSASYFATRFIEDEGVPKDSQVVGYTWKYVRRDGGPDRRFNNNRQIPIALYGHMELRSQTGMNIHLHVSNLDLAEKAAHAFTDISHSASTKTGPKEKPKAESSMKSEKDPETTAFETLGLRPGASKDELERAHRNMAQMYHPDKVAHLAPEFRALAEERMKEINAAFELLKNRQKANSAESTG